MLALALLALLFALLWDISHGYNSYFAKLGPREAALAEASHGAAFIVLPVLMLPRFGGVLPTWSLLAALALMIWGGLGLFKGAKFSVGWRDPKLIARAALKIALAVLLFRAIDARQFGDVGPLFDALLPLLGWWLLITGLTKLLLVLRGFPAAPWDGDPPDPQHGDAGFANPGAAAKGLGKK